MSLIIVFVTFELNSWYHFGDKPTTAVLIRLITTFIVIETINYYILKYFSNRKSNK